jgi:hypothetical protein
MIHAMHRLQNSAAHGTRQVFCAERAPALAWAPNADNRAAAAQVLQQALAFVGLPADAAGLNPPTAADEAFNAAVRLYESGHWEQAFVDLAALADREHAPAAKFALLMLRYGAAVYTTSFVVHPVQVARWAQRVLRASPR